LEELERWPPLADEHVIASASDHPHPYARWRAGGEHGIRPAVCVEPYLARFGGIEPPDEATADRVSGNADSHRPVRQSFDQNVLGGIGGVQVGVAGQGQVEATRGVRQLLTPSAQRRRQPGVMPRRHAFGHRLDRRREHVVGQSPLHRGDDRIPDGPLEPRKQLPVEIPPEPGEAGDREAT
jgi:hypothetical protein